jgi:DNA-binding MarR family transcriptional regulator
VEQSIATWLRLARFYHKADRRLLANLRCYDLSIAQFDVLAQLGAAEGITQQELAYKLLVTKGNVTQLLDRMTGGGLLTRRQDGRANRLYLTEAGRALFLLAIPRQEDEIARVMEPLTRQEQAQLSALLRKLDRGLDARPSPPLALPLGEESGCDAAPPDGSGWPSAQVGS